MKYLHNIGQNKLAKAIHTHTKYAAAILAALLLMAAAVAFAIPGTYASEDTTNAAVKAEMEKGEDKAESEDFESEYEEAGAENAESGGFYCNSTPQYNYDCPHSTPCYCHAEYEPNADASIAPQGGYIGIVPLSEITLQPVHNIAQLVERIGEVPFGTGNAYIIPIQFQGNVYTTTSASPQATIVIAGNATGGRHIILDSNNGVNQVWQRDHTSNPIADNYTPFGGGQDRHFHVRGGGTLELRNVTLTRSVAFVNANPTAVSGGVAVSGATADWHSHFIMNHANATISRSRTNMPEHTGGSGAGGVGLGNRSRFTMFEGNIYYNITQSHQAGGIFLDSVAANVPAQRVVAVIHDGIIRDNISHGNGGGIGACCNVELHIHGGQIFNNTAHLDGGGVFTGSWNNNAMYMTGGSIGHSNPALGNIAERSGGGVYARAANAYFNMSGGAIYNNSANGMLADQGGGGVYASATDSFTFTGGVIGGRLVGANLVPAGNSAQRGGGVFFRGTFAMGGTSTYTIIMSNHAGLYGGGVYVYKHIQYERWHDWRCGSQSWQYRCPTGRRGICASTGGDF